MRDRLLIPEMVGLLHAFRGETAMATLIKTLAAVAACTVLATSAFAQSAKDIRGASPYVAVKNEPAPKLIVDPPLPEGLPIGVYWAQYRVENLRIVQVFGPEARQISPRVGHLHITVDDLPWWWADASDNNTVDIANLPPGKHKVRIQLVNSDHEVFTGQEVTHTFTIPARQAASRE
jgi:hypothetical protein